MTETPTVPMRVLVVDDHAILRDALSMVLSASGVRVVGSTGDGLSAIAMAKSLTPDFVVMDLRMPDLDGATATRRIRADDPDIRIVIVSAHGEIAWIETAFAAGASAYVLKDHAYEDLLVAIRTVRDGAEFVSPSIAGGAAFLRERLSAATP